MAIKIGDRIEVQTPSMMYPQVLTVETIIKDQYFGWSYESQSYIRFLKKDILNVVGGSKK